MPFSVTSKTAYDAEAQAAGEMLYKTVAKPKMFKNVLSQRRSVSNVTCKELLLAPTYCMGRIGKIQTL